MLILPQAVYVCMYVYSYPTTHDKILYDRAHNKGAQVKEFQPISISWKPDGQNIECSGGAAHCAHGGTAGLGYHIYICTIVHLLLSHSSFL